MTPRTSDHHTIYRENGGPEATFDVPIVIDHTVKERRRCVAVCDFDSLVPAASFRVESKESAIDPRFASEQKPVESSVNVVPSVAAIIMEQHVILGTVTGGTRLSTTYCCQSPSMGYVIVPRVCPVRLTLQV